jgi:hypothetical protein
LTVGSNGRCVECSRALNRARNGRRNPIYHDPAYLASPREGTCHICGKQTNGFGTRDHIVSVKAGKARGWTIAQINAPSNLAPAHSWCNFSKGAS